MINGDLVSLTALAVRISEATKSMALRKADTCNLSGKNVLKVCSAAQLIYTPKMKTIRIKFFDIITEGFSNKSILVGE